MINLVTQVIKKHQEWLRCPGQPLSFMKMSTPSSGRSYDGGKVIVFIFEQGQALPTICLKTTRTYVAGEVIRRNYANLKFLESGVKGSDFVKMFATPLELYDDGEVVFSLETVCPGVMLSAQAQSIDVIVEKYIAWQAQLVSASQMFWYQGDIQNLVHEIINKLELSEESSNELRAYYHKLPLDPGIKLPVIVQHGDMTPDNVLISGEKVYFIDYDHVGVSMLPGFDLFNFLFFKSKLPVQLLRLNCEKYFPTYFKKIGAEVESFKALFFIYYLQESLRKGLAIKKKSEPDIISGFRDLMNER